MSNPYWRIVICLFRYTSGLQAPGRFAHVGQFKEQRPKLYYVCMYIHIYTSDYVRMHMCRLHPLQTKQNPSNNNIPSTYIIRYKYNFFQFSSILFPTCLLLTPNLRIISHSSTYLRVTTCQGQSKAKRNPNIILSNESSSAENSTSLSFLFL